MVDLQKQKKDFDNVLKDKPGNPIALKQVEIISTALDNEAKGKEALKKNQYNDAINYFTAILQESPDIYSIRLLRAECAAQLDDTTLVLEDTIRVLKQDQTNVKALHLRGKALFLLGEKSMAIQLYREGLRFDPDNVLLRNEYKKTKSFEENSKRGEQAFQKGEWDFAVEEFNNAIQLYPNVWIYIVPLQQSLCLAYIKLSKSQEAIQVSNEILNRNNDNIEALLCRAEAKLLLKEYDSAISDYTKAYQLQPNNPKISEGLQNAKKLQKMSTRKDYYAILGLDQKTATSSTIRKAFHKLALENHPDKVPEEEKQSAQLRFREINEAYEVLSDEEKKRKYDNGEDIQVEQHQEQGFPFGGGGPFTFHFNFGGR